MSNNQIQDSDSTDLSTRATRQEVVDTFCILAIEFFLVMLPIIVIFSVMGFNRQLQDFWSDFEWSFVAAVLFGLTLVKLVSGCMSGKHRPRWQPIVLFLAVVVFFMLLNLILLAMTYSEHLSIRPESAHSPIISENPVIGHSKKWIIATQGGFFVLSSFTFFILGGYGQLRLTRSETRV
jgi:hypothetical protein